MVKLVKIMTLTAEEVNVFYIMSGTGGNVYRNVFVRSWFIHNERLHRQMLRFAHLILL